MSDDTIQPDTADKLSLAKLADDLIASYQSQPGMQHLDSTFLPNRDRTVQILELLRRIVFPGFFDDQRITSGNVKEHLDQLLSELHELLYEQVRQALRYGVNVSKGNGQGDKCDECDHTARQLVDKFLMALPQLRSRLALDVQATFEGDPAAVSTDENVFCYPGIDAVFTYRIAHELWKLQVPLIPRIMTEYTHNETGIDIHPGATIGASFCIDHGTGIVIGETCVIGDRVKIYQGVTLGALSTKGGQEWRGRQRHPIIEDDVTIYGGAIILGGSTTIGKGATIGGSVFITASVPAGHSVSMDRSNLRIKPPRERKSEGKS